MEAKELYQKLDNEDFVVSEQEMQTYNYPRQDPQDPTRCEIPGRYKQQVSLRREDKQFTCERCEKVYRVDPTGVPLGENTGSKGRCFYHAITVTKRDPMRYEETVEYPCCQLYEWSSEDFGCLDNWCHVHRGAQELTNYCDFVETQAKPERDHSGHGVYALDCHMCYTTIGYELARVTVVDQNGQVVYEQLVKPEGEILDYDTSWSGITRDQMDHVTTRLPDIQRHLLDLFSNESILIGHGLDFKVLKLFHKRFVNIGRLYSKPYDVHRSHRLKWMIKEHLNIDIKQGDYHDSKENVRAALGLVLKKVNSRTSSESSSKQVNL